MTTLLETHLLRRAKNLNELLSYSRQAIIDCTERSQDEREQAGQTLATIRVFLSDYERDHPEDSSEIQEWWKQVLQPLDPIDAQDLRIDTAKQTQTRLARYEARFQNAWGLPSREILQSKYNPASGFNATTMQSLVQFAERSLFENGQAALEEALRLRLQSDDDRPYRTREPHIVPSDVKKAQELYDSHHHHNGATENEHVSTRRKRKRVAEEDRAFSGKYKAKSILNPTTLTIDGMNAENGAEKAIGRDVELELEGTQSPHYEDDRVRPYHQATDKTAQVPASYGDDRVRHSSDESNKGTQTPGNGDSRVRSHYQETDKTAQIPPSFDVHGVVPHCEQSNIGTQTPSYGENRFRHLSQERDEGTQAPPPNRDNRVRHQPEESDKGTEAPPYGFDRVHSHHEETEKMAEAPLSYGNDRFRHHSEESSKGIEAPPSYGDKRVHHRPEESDKGNQGPPYGDDRVHSHHQKTDRTAQAPPSYGDNSLRHHYKDSDKGPQATFNRGDESPSIEIGRGLRGPTQRESLDGNSLSDFFLPDHTGGSLSLRSPMSAPPATPSPQGPFYPHKLPTTDLAGALSTLEPGKWLSASAIELVLSTCCPENARIIDSACFNLGANNPTFSNLRPCGDHIAKVFLPIHHGDHWTLAVFDRQTRIITHYNSLPTTSMFKDALDTALPIFMSKIAGDETYPTMAYKELGSQENSYDCGVHVLITALCAFVDYPPPTVVDTMLWRLIFRALLTETLQTEPHLESIMDTDASQGVGSEILGVSLEDYKVRLTDSKLSVAHAGSALDLLNRISNKIAISTLSWSQLPGTCQRFLSSLQSGFSELRPYSRVFNLAQFQEMLQAGLTKGDMLHKKYLKAEKSVRAAIGSAQKAKDIRIGISARLSRWVEEISGREVKEGS